MWLSVGTISTWHMSVLSLNPLESGPSFRATCPEVQPRFGAPQTRAHDSYFQAERYISRDTRTLCSQHNLPLWLGWEYHQQLLVGVDHIRVVGDGHIRDTHTHTYYTYTHAHTSYTHNTHTYTYVTHTHTLHIIYTSTHYTLHIQTCWSQLRDVAMILGTQITEFTVFAAKYVIFSLFSPWLRLRDTYAHLYT